MDLEEERQRNSRLEKMAPHQMSAEEAEWETKKAMDDYKFKLQKAEQDINTLQTNVRRLINNTSQISASPSQIWVFVSTNFFYFVVLGCSIRIASHTIQNCSRDSWKVRRGTQNREKEDAKRGNYDYILYIGTSLIRTLTFA